jgi:hypothetical protein
MQPLFRGGPTLIPRMGIDVLVDRETNLLRTNRGISVFSEPSLVERFGSADRVVSIPKGLRVQQRGRGVSHYETTPAQPMTFERYSELLQQVILRPAAEEPLSEGT